MRGVRGRSNRSGSPTVILHTPQLVERKPEPAAMDSSQLIQQLALQLAQTLQQQQPQQNRRNTLDVNEAWEEVFERKISKFKLYQMLRSGECPSVKIGSRYLLRRDTLEAWMRQQEQGYR
ncbi:helix-turn-helix domain-containing protein [Brevibacillus parabrevis]|uniref:helix-turn-helix domain-containing protein n=1 Tax=Brevibacillus parabrevis TaxID=54914 RepID=UPI003B845420